MAILLEHKELLSTQSESKTLPEWLEYFNSKYTKKQLYCYCHRNNYKFKPRDKNEISRIQSNNARKYHINQDYFKTWSRDMAYIFGFWCADGCIYNKKMFDITVHKKDRYIIKKIAEKLDYKGNLYDYVDRQAVRINFSCVIIYNDLIALGGKENKSLTLEFPKVPKEYLPDFIRGYFDGDGCACRIKGNRFNTSFCSGSKIFLEELLRILKKEAGIEGGSIDFKSYKLTFGKKDSIKLGEYIYKNNPELFLLRKRQKFNL